MNCLESRPATQLKIFHRERKTVIDENMLCPRFVKLIVDPKTERILGVGIVGVGAGEMIAEATLAVETAAVARDLAETIHAHPTLSETVMEAAESVYGQATHSYRPKR
jgi:pyruvate/2-oxoglutarate dehydrogenase complex dihydrolipoamide dehydrogenase (E3) component